MTKARTVKQAKHPDRKMLPEAERLSNVMETLVDEVSEKIFKRLRDEGYVAEAIWMDSNIGSDLLNAIEDELRKCIRG